MEIEFDPAKSERNVRERGLSFELTADFDFETAVYVEDNRYNYGERRIRALGYIEERLYALVYTVRGETLRVISLRRANRREVKIYEDATRS
ncbi:MAG: BrnT family toxin [Candidatus Korobacteraceae bacterium]